MGSDIDGRQIRGKSKLIGSGFQQTEVTISLEKGKGIKPGILRAAEQYRLQDKFLDFYIFDVTRGPIRRGGWIDAIITDPPCMSNPFRLPDTNGAYWQMALGQVQSVSVVRRERSL